MYIQVMRGASCWSDHHMVRVKVRLDLACQQKRRGSTLPIAVHTLHSTKQKEAYQQKLDEYLVISHIAETTQQSSI